MSSVLCIYHGPGCADGLLAAWAVKHALGDGVEFVAAKYGDNPMSGEFPARPDGTRYNQFRDRDIITAVLGIRERGGRTRAKPVAGTDAATLQPEIRAAIELGATIYTDEHGGYTGLGNDYAHETIVHSAGEYVRDDVSTNGIESVWAVLKRGLHGVYHHASPKHLHRYVDEFTFRLNDGNVERHTLARLESLTEASFGKRLTYKALIA